MVQISRILVALAAYLIIQASGLIASAQVLDTIFPSTENSRYLYAIQLHELDSQTVLEDTVLEYGYRIHPLQKNAISYIDCGLPGTPAFTFGLTTRPAEGFDPGIHVMDPSFFQRDSIKLYRSPDPRTFLKYAQGHNELIYLVAEHSQNIFDRWNFGVNYRRIKSQNWYYDNLDGLTLARMPNNYNFSAYSRFYTANRKYEAVVTYLWNKATIAETGGIIDTEKFDTSDRRSKQYFNSGYLGGATNIFKESNVALTQFFRFGQSRIEIKENPDTLGVMDTIHLFQPKGHFFHEFQYSDQLYKYTDQAPNMDFYPIRLYEASTNDSFTIRTISNEAGLFFLPSEKAPRLSVSGLHELILIDQSGHLEQSINQLWLKGKVSQPLFGQMARFSGKFGLFGYNSGDVHLKGTVDLKNNDSSHRFTISGKAQYSMFRPAYMQSYFVSNHYLWYNKFDKTGYTMASLGFRYLHHIRLDAAFERIDNPVLFNTDAQPNQFVSVQILSAALSNRMDLWRFHLKSEGLLKIVPDNSPIRVPLISVKESFYYEGPFFKGNMLARIGVDLYFYSAFKANYYNPVTRQFQIQNDLTIGDYPLFDLFLSGKIRTVDLYFIYRHASAGFFGNDYYASPRYPQITSGFRLGLSWRLFN